MSDEQFIRAIAEKWIELGGDAEGLSWNYLALKEEIARQIEESK